MHYPILSLSTKTYSFNLTSSSSHQRTNQKLKTITNFVSMASSTCAAVSMAVPLITRTTQMTGSVPLLNPILPVIRRPSSRAVSRKFEVRASLKEKAVTGLTAAALAASMVVPDVAEAASGGSPSLKNFLLSIVAGGVVLSAILGAIIGVSNFDPVKRT